MAVRKMMALALLVAVGGCGVATSQGDYPHYGSVAELLERATLVVEASMANPRAGKLYPMDGEKSDAAAVDITVYDATVTRVHKGSAGGTIQVKQPSGEDPFREGRTYLLFLETYPDAAASLLNPDQARYEVDPTGGYRSVDGNTLTVTAKDLKPTP